MIGLGTLVNTAGVVLGGILGLILGKRITPRFQDCLMKACGLCVIFIGAAGTLEKMLTVENGALSASGSMLLIASLCLGALLGELLNIERHTERLGEYLKVKTRSTKDAKFVEGFVTTSLTVCVGAMAVIGPIRDGIYHDPSLLVTKAILDLIIVAVLSAAYGKGCVFSALPILVIEGGLTLGARLIQPVMTPEALSNLSMVGSALIFCVGVNLFFGKTVKVANLLPALIIAVIWAFFPF